MTSKMLWFLVKMNCGFSQCKMVLSFNQRVSLNSKILIIFVFQLLSLQNSWDCQKKFWFSMNSYNRNTDWYHFSWEKTHENEQYCFSWKYCLNWQFCHDFHHFLWFSKSCEFWPQVREHSNIISLYFRPSWNPPPIRQNSHRLMQPLTHSRAWE